MTVFKISPLAFALILFVLMMTGPVGNYAAGMTINTRQATVTQTIGLKIFTVIVSENGFNGSANALNLEVSQGDQVIITFVFGDQIVNAHEIEIEGYGIQTSILDKANPTSKVEFDAEQVGSFLIHCIIPCIGMENLQNAYLIVKPGSGILIGTSVTVQSLELNGSLLNIFARLTDRAGNPLSDLIVNFYVSTEFGMMKIGDNITDTNGMVQLAYPLASVRNMTVGAYFPGSGIYEGGNATASIAPSNPGTLFVSVGSETSPHPSGEAGFFDIRLVGLSTEVSLPIVTLVLIVVLSVWSTYAYVIGLMLKIRRHNAKNKNGGS